MVFPSTAIQLPLPFTLGEGNFLYRTQELCYAVPRDFSTRRPAENLYHTLQCSLHADVDRQERTDGFTHKHIALLYDDSAALRQSVDTSTKRHFGDVGYCTCSFGRNPNSIQWRHLSRALTALGRAT